MREGNVFTGVNRVEEGTPWPLVPGPFSGLPQPKVPGPFWGRKGLPLARIGFTPLNTPPPLPTGIGRMCGVGGMPLAFTQENFLVVFVGVGRLQLKVLPPFVVKLS